MNNVPLRRAGAAVTVKLKPGVSDRMHTGVNVLETRNNVLSKLVRVPRKEAMIIIAIWPVARLQHLKIAPINGLTITVYAIADRFSISEFSQFTFERRQSRF